jgi:ketosteroid isomerase-like protein
MTERVRRAIAEAGIKLMEKIHNGDAAGVAAMYTEDAVILPPNMEKVSGRMAIEEFWAIGISQLGLKFSELRTEELLGSGDFFITINSYTLTTQPAGQKPVEDKGKMVVIWKQTAEGWRVHRDMWNSNMPPP